MGGYGVYLESHTWLVSAPKCQFPEFQPSTLSSHTVSSELGKLTEQIIQNGTFQGLSRIGWVPPCVPARHTLVSLKILNLKSHLLLSDIRGTTEAVSCNLHHPKNLVPPSFLAAIAFSKSSAVNESMKGIHQGKNEGEGREGTWEGHSHWSLAQHFL